MDIRSLSCGVKHLAHPLVACKVYCDTVNNFNKHLLAAGADTVSNHLFGASVRIC